jgi:hypothetical protein
MTTQNKVGRLCSLFLIGLGIAWVGCIAYQMNEEHLFPWQSKPATVQAPKCPEFVPVP